MCILKKPNKTKTYTNGMWISSKELNEKIQELMPLMSEVTADLVEYWEVNVFELWEQDALWKLHRLFLGCEQLTDYLDYNDGAAREEFYDIVCDRKIVKITFRKDDSGPKCESSQKSRPAALRPLVFQQKIHELEPKLTHIIEQLTPTWQGRDMQYWNNDDLARLFKLTLDAGSVAEIIKHNNCKTKEKFIKLIRQIKFV